MELSKQRKGGEKRIFTLEKISRREVACATEYRRKTERGGTIRLGWAKT